MASKEHETWRKHSANIATVITVSDAARRDLVNKLYAAGILPFNVQVQIHKQDATAGADTLMRELLSNITVANDMFHKILSVMESVEQLKEMVEDMRRKCPDSKATPSTTNIGINNNTTVEPETKTPAPSQVTTGSICNEEAIIYLKLKFNDILRDNHTTIGQSVEASRDDFANKMFENRLISRGTRNSKEYTAMMDEFVMMITQSRDIEQLRKNCANFLEVLEYVGGPAALAGTNLKCDWNEAMKTKYGVVFLT